MRILHMIPDIGISNGVMSIILNYAKKMPSDVNFDVVYFAEKAETRKADIEALGGRVFKTSRPSIFSLLSLKMLRFFIKHRGEWDAVHIHCPHFAVFIAPFARLTGIKKIAVQCHTTVFSLKGRVHQFINRVLGLYAKYCIRARMACSNAAGIVWYKGKSFKILRCGVDCEKFKYNEEVRARIRHDLGLEDKYVIGHIGRTDVVQKNHPFLLKVFAEFKKKKENAVLLLAGAQETEDLSALADKLGIKDSVIYLGLRTDIADLLQGMDFFLFPSTKEGLPVSVVEAQAAGLRTLMSDSITFETAATELVYAKSLDDGPEAWANSLMKVYDYERTDTSEEIKESGWAIEECTNTLLSYYKSQVY